MLFRSSVSSSQSVSVEEKKVISIPSYSSKIVSEYSINYSLFSSCDQKLFPSKKQVKALSFNSNNSPLTFSNIITYKVGENGSYQNVVNEFYISDITNISQKNELVKYKIKDCDNNSIEKKKMKDAASNRFYISYKGSKSSGVTKY